MGLLSNFIKKGVGFLGNRIANFANTATGGVAGILGNKLLKVANKSAGLIGKVARGVGQQIFSDKARDFMSKAADTALKYIPDGKVKETLSKINDSAQGRPIGAIDSNSAKVETSMKNKASSPAAITQQIAQPPPTSGMRRGRYG